MNKLITILGPTASGKSTLGIELAKEFDGEIVSADSRQVYRGLDIGTGKVTLEEQKLVPHHLLDVVEPMGNFSLAHYQKLAFAAIDGIIKRGQPASSAGRLPFLVGGTALYIYAVVDNYNLSNVGPNAKQRQELERLSTTELQAILSHHTHPPILTSSDYQNPRRLIRAIEIVKTTNQPIPALSPVVRTTGLNILQIGIKKSPQELKKLIAARLRKRIKGIIIEVKNLHLPVGRQAKTGLSFKRLEELGLEYRFVAQYLQQKISYGEMIDAIQKESLQFTKRQMTWFKRDQRIHWVKNQTEAQKLIKNFLH